MIFELDPVDALEVAAVGEPGQRRFFLLAAGQGRTLTLACEKAQIQALIVGESVILVVITALAAFSGKKTPPLALVGASFETAGIIIGGAAFALVGFLMYRWILRMGAARSA